MSPDFLQIGTLIIYMSMVGKLSQTCDLEPGANKLRDIKHKSELQ